MSVLRTQYNQQPQEVEMSVGVKGHSPRPKMSKPAPPPPPPPEERIDHTNLRHGLNVAGARFYRPSSRPVPGHRWNLQQLRAGEAIVPSQSGTNTFDSQKGLTGFGTIRNTKLKELNTNPNLIPSEAELADLPDQPNLQIGNWTVADLRKGQGIVISQSGSNKFDSQKGLGAFGTVRNTKMKQINTNPALAPNEAELAELPEVPNLKIGNWTVKQLREGQGIIIAQSGSNKFDSQKGLGAFGTVRNTKMKQINTNPSLAPNEAELADFPPEPNMKVGKWTVQQLREGQGIIIAQSGSNKFDSQKGMTGFGTVRNTTTKQKQTNPNLIPNESELPNNQSARIGNWTVADLRKGQGIIISQSGSNQFASQKGMTGMGTPRDVKGKHLKRIWELEYPDEGVAY